MAKRPQTDGGKRPDARAGPASAFPPDDFLQSSEGLTSSSGERPEISGAIAARMQAGRMLRNVAPLEAHASWQAPADRPDPVSTIEAQNRDRVTDLVPIRHGRMSVSPLAFYRGGAAIMAWDLAHTPSPGLRVQCCGDAHLSNFGFFAAPDRRLVFDLNDFDETLPAPFEWDVKRLAASLVVVARFSEHRPKVQRAAARAAASGYRRTIAEAALLPFLEVWYARVDVESLLASLSASAPQGSMKRIKKDVAKAYQRTSLGSLAKFATVVDGIYRIAEQPPLIVRPPLAQRAELTALVKQGMADYARALSPDRRTLFERYHYVDFARKVVGVGSVGTEALMVLLMGGSDRDPLFIQLKQAQPSVLEPYAGRGEYAHHGERVVQGQRLMQSASDELLGWVTGAGEAHREFYARQLRDMKGSARPELMAAEGLAAYAQLCGATLARAHARAGDAATIAGYLGDDETFDDAIQRFSTAYADQNENDYATFLAAADEGRIPVQAGV